MKLKDTLIKLINANGVTGYERYFIDVIQNLVLEYVDEIRSDEMGNLYAIKRGPGDRDIALFAHMDELGLVVCNIDSEGFIRFKKLGGIDDRVLPSSHVEFIVDGREKVPGVIGWLPPHLMLNRSAEYAKVVQSDDMFIDIGVSSAEEVRELGIEIGTPVVFNKQISFLENGKIAARGIDNRAGCAVLVEILKTINNNFKGTLTVVFTTQEEFGLRGAKAVSLQKTPDLAVVVDTISAPDFPGVAGVYKNQFVQGGGPVLRMVDSSTIINPQTISKVKTIAENKNIRFQKAVAGGSTDAAALQVLGEGMNVIPVCIPCRYSHSLTEVVSISDIEETIKLVKELIVSFE